MNTKTLPLVSVLFKPSNSNLTKISFYVWIPYNRASGVLIGTSYSSPWTSVRSGVYSTILSVFPSKNIFYRLHVIRCKFIDQYWALKRLLALINDCTCQNYLIKAHLASVHEFSQASEFYSFSTFHSSILLFWFLREEKRNRTPKNTAASQYTNITKIKTF